MADQVICVDDALPATGCWSGDTLVKNRIYTIRGQFEWCGESGYYLNEISAGPFTDGSDRGYNIKRFRPIKDSSLDIFRDTTRKIPDDQFDNETIDSHKVTL